MASPGAGARQKGYNYQRLEERGWNLIRRSAGESGDDITLIDLPWMSVEVKCHKATSWGAWVAQAKAQAGDRVPVLIGKRHGKTDPAMQWVVMTLEEFERVMQRLRRP
jgi:hypothetical protein